MTPPFLQHVPNYGDFVFLGAPTLARNASALLADVARNPAAHYSLSTGPLLPSPYLVTLSVFQSTQLPDYPIPDPCHPELDAARGE